MIFENGVDPRIIPTKGVCPNMSAREEEEQSDRERARASLLSGGERVAKGRQRDDDSEDG